MIVCAPDRDKREALCTRWVWKTDFLRWPEKTQAFRSADSNLRLRVGLDPEGLSVEAGGEGGAGHWSLPAKMDGRR